MQPVPPTQREGVILVLATILLIVVFGFVAFTVDIGYMAVVKAELQSAADAAAIAAAPEIPYGEAVVRDTAKALALKNYASGAPVTLQDADIDIGYFNYSTKEFVVDVANGNAVRVRANVYDQPFFFAPVLGSDQFDMTATSIAMPNPRDIVFVVDLSGSMNDDTEPCWATEVLTDTYTPQGYPLVAKNLMQDVYDDFGYGTFPGTLQYIGAPLGVAEDNYCYAEMTKDDGPLTLTTIPVQYRILNTDPEEDRKVKAYSWIIDNQIATVMPNAKPVPDSTLNYGYWEKYIDYITYGAWIGVPPPPPEPDPDADGGDSGDSGDPEPPPDPPPTPPSVGATDFENSSIVLASFRATSQLSNNVFTLPHVTQTPAEYPGCPRRGAYEYTWLPWQDGDRIYGFNNPNKVSFPGASWSLPYDFSNKIGYQTYVQFMMDWGRERSPEVENSTNADPTLAGKTPLSVLSPHCPFHDEATLGGTFSFPPRSQPMHAVRRALIAGLNTISARNNGATSGSGDRVSIVTFDGLDIYHMPKIVQPLTDDYYAAMVAASRLQASSDIGRTTSTESGIKLAKQHLEFKTSDNNPGDDPLGPQGRQFTTKVIILVTDGMPNQWETDPTVIDQYVLNNPSPEYYATGYDWYNSVIMQTHQFFSDRGKFYAVGMGLGADYDFMDRLARMGSTDIGGYSPRSSGNPAEYEQQLIDILENIINRPGAKIVE